MKRFRIGLKLWSVNTDAYLREACRLYADEVFDYLELYCVPGSEATAPLWRATGIPCIVHAPHSARHHVNLADKASEAHNRRCIDEARRFADRLDVPIIIVHGGILGQTEEIIRQMRCFNDSRFLIENKPWLPLGNESTHLAGSTPDEIRTIMEGVGCGFCLDIGHMVASANAHGEDWQEFYAAFLELKPEMFHLSDLMSESQLDQHLHFGHGTLPLPAIIKRMPSDSRISIETAKDTLDNLLDFESDSKILNSLEDIPDDHLSAL